MPIPTALLFTSIVIYLLAFDAVEMTAKNCIISDSNGCSTTIPLDKFTRKSIEIRPVKIFTGKIKNREEGTYYENFAIGKNGEIIIIDKSITIISQNKTKQYKIKKKYRNSNYFFYDNDENTLLIRGNLTASYNIAHYTLQGKLLSEYGINGSQLTNYKNTIISFDGNGSSCYFLHQHNNGNVKRVDVKNIETDAPDYFSQPNVFIENDTIYMIKNSSLYILPVNNPNAVQKICFDGIKDDESFYFYSVIGKIQSSLIVVGRVQDRSSDAKVSLLDINNRTKTDVSIHGISENLHSDVYSEDGTGNHIEYSLWIDQVVYYYNSAKYELYFLINTEDGIEVYRTNLQYIF
jgi:hypothetical protein